MSLFAGAHLVEEYRKNKYEVYYKCNLCGMHGKKSDIYSHLNSKKHTERYIVSNKWLYTGT